MKTIKQNIRNLTKEQYLTLKNYCKNSNALYNCALWVCNEHYKQTGKYIGYNNLYHHMKNNIHYKNMTSFNAQAILQLLDKNYRSFFALLRRKQRLQYKGEVNPPKYKKPKNEYILIFNVQRIIYRKEKQYLKFTKDLKIKFTYDIPGKIIQAIIKPNNFGAYTLLLTYKEKEVEKHDINKDNFLGIDLGLDNLMACVSNVSPSFIMNGKPLKSYNNYFNKQKSKIQSELMVKNKKHYSKKLANLNRNREFWIENYFNQIVAYIGKHCLENNIGKVILGYNQTWKKNINIGHVNNQRFVSVPHWKLRRKLRNKMEYLGIELIETSEDYTSLCSALDNEAIEKHDEYLGKRVYRGLFKAANGKCVNADINGAMNIMRKVIPEINFNGIWAFIVSPRVLHPCNL